MITSLNICSQLFMNLKQELLRVRHDRSTDTLCFQVHGLPIICTHFSIIFSPPRLCGRAAISIRNYPTKLHTQNQIHISVCSLSHIPFVGLFLYLQTFSGCVTGFVRTFDSDCHTSSALNISINKSVAFALFFL